MTGPYELVITAAARKAFENLPDERQRLIQPRIDALALNPRPPRSTKLAGHANVWRIRVGDYRIIYEIHENRRIVIVMIIAHRREAYRGL